MDTKSYICFLEQDVATKTRLWKVISNSNGSLLGTIKWFGRWRKYCFFSTIAVFDWFCLSEIAEFCEEQTALYNHSKKILSANK